LESAESALSAGRDRDIVRFGQHIEIAREDTANDIVCFGCSVTVRGRVNGDVVVFGGSLQVEGAVTGDAVVLGGSTSAGPEATIGGDLVTLGGAVHRDPDAKISGEVTNIPGPFVVGGMGLAGLLLIVFLTSLPVAIVFALVCYAIVGQNRVQVLAGAVRVKPGAMLLAGLVGTVGAVALIVAFAQIPHWAGLFIILEMCLVFLLAVVGYTGLSFWMGRIIAAGSSPVVAVLIGAIVISLLQAVPFLGGIAVIVFWLLALGSAAFTGFGTGPEWLANALGGRRTVPPSAPSRT
jgi:hypothetical protein